MICSSRANRRIGGRAKVASVMRNGARAMRGESGGSRLSSGPTIMTMAQEMVGQRKVAGGRRPVPGPLRRWRAAAIAGCSALALGCGGTERAAAQSVVATGDVSPFPASSPVWTIPESRLSVGDFDVGQLTIIGGGQVFDRDGYVGFYQGAEGTVTVTGKGSSWTNTGTLLVGVLGNGRLIVADGATVSSVTSAELGVYGGDSSVIVTGGGSKLITSGILLIADGADAHSELIARNGGAVFSAAASIGDNGVGAMTVTGVGSTWTNSGDVSLGRGISGTLTIADKAKVSIGSGSGTLTLGGGGVLTIGAAPGSAPVAAGFLDAGRVVLAAGSAAINFNHTDSAYGFAPQLAGNGNIAQLAGTTVLTADSSGFTGTTAVSGGKLVVNGALGGSLRMAAGSVIGGSGTIPGLAVVAGGVVAPGNSIGTLTVAGNIGFASGSVYQVEIDPAGRSDRLQVNGNATLAGGTVQVAKAAGVYLPGMRYTIVNATGGVAGTFAGLTLDGALPFVSFGLGYDANNVYLDIARSRVSFASVATTRNQVAVGGALDTPGLGGALSGALVQQSIVGARAAFDQLSGELHASMRGVLVDDSRFVRDAAINRLRASFGAVGADRSPVMAYAAGGLVEAAPTTDRVAVWTHGFGAWGHGDGDGNAARFDRSTGGVLFGADTAVLDTWRVGIEAGYSRTDFNLRDRLSSGSSDNYHVGVFGGTRFGAFGVRSGAAYTWHDLATTRTVGFNGFADSLKGYDKAGTAQVFGEVGYGIDLGRTVFGAASIEPFANIAYAALSARGFTEQGGAAALSGLSGTTGVTFATVGVRAANHVTLGSADAVVKGSLGWRHAEGDTTPVARLAFAGSSAFGVAGLPVAREAAVVEAGFDVALNRWMSLGVTYGGQFSANASDQSVRGTFGVRF